MHAGSVDHLVYPITLERLTGALTRARLAYLSRRVVADMQREVRARALAVGINWIDTAPGYGDGRSEASQGRALADLSARERFYIATKVRLTLADLGDVEAAVRR